MFKEQKISYFRLEIFQKSLLSLMAFLFIVGFTITFFEFEAYSAPDNVPQLMNPNFEIEIVQTGLAFPTQMTFVDDKTFLIGQKNDGKIFAIRNFESIGTVLDLNVDPYQARGLVGLESVNHQGDVFVFVYYAESKGNYDMEINELGKPGSNNGTKLFRYKWNGTSLVEPLLLLQPLDWAGATHHGGAMAIQDDNLFLIVGDNEQKGFLRNSPDEKFEGKSAIFKIKFDGEASDANPFSEERYSKMFAYGIRNSFGLAIDPVTNHLWDTENGNTDYDEVNLVLPGFNSGWDKIMGPNGTNAYTSNLNQMVSLNGSHYSDPEFSWNNTVGPTAIEFLESKNYGEEFLNDMFTGDANNGAIYHFELNENRDGFYFEDEFLEDLVADNRTESKSLMFGKNLGIITDIETGPDGYLYAVSLYQNFEGMEGFFQPHRNPDFVEKASNWGTVFRIIPKSLIMDEKNELLPIKIQIQNGIIPHNVICKEELNKIFKKTDNSPACVKIETMKKLVERGWAKN